MFSVRILGQYSRSVIASNWPDDVDQGDASDLGGDGITLPNHDFTQVILTDKDAFFGGGERCEVADGVRDDTLNRVNVKSTCPTFGTTEALAPVGDLNEFASVVCDP